MPELKFEVFRGKSWVSKAIRYFTRSRYYSHTAVMLPDNRLIEAWNHNGGMKQWTDYSAIEKHTPGTKYEIWKLPVTQEVYDHCMSFYIHHAEVKTPYDYAGIIGFVLKKTVRQNKKKLFCSELSMGPLCNSMGWDKIEPSHISPENFIDIIQAAGGSVRYHGAV